MPDRRRMSSRMPARRCRLPVAAAGRLVHGARALGAGNATMLAVACAYLCMVGVLAADLFGPERRPALHLDTAALVLGDQVTNPDTIYVDRPGGDAAATWSPMGVHGTQAGTHDQPAGRAGAVRIP